MLHQCVACFILEPHCQLASDPKRWLTKTGAQEERRPQACREEMQGEARSTTVNPTGVQLSLAAAVGGSINSALDGFLTRLETRLGDLEHHQGASSTEPTTTPHSPPTKSGVSPSVSGGGEIAGATMLTTTASSGKEHCTLFWG